MRKAKVRQHRQEAVKAEEKTLAEQEAEVIRRKREETFSRVKACTEEVSAVMDKYRCRFAPIPKYQLSADGNHWELTIELQFRPVP